MFINFLWTSLCLVVEKNEMKFKLISLCCFHSSYNQRWFRLNLKVKIRLRLYKKAWLGSVMWIFNFLSSFLFLSFNFSNVYTWCSKIDWNNKENFSVKGSPTSLNFFSSCNVFKHCSWLEFIIIDIPISFFLIRFCFFLFLLIWM